MLTLKVLSLLHSQSQAEQEPKTDNHLHQWLIWSSHHVHVFRRWEETMQTTKAPHWKDKGLKPVTLLL